MRRLLAVLLVFPLPAAALSGDAQEFMAIIKALEPVHCQKRKLRYEIMMAQVEQRSTDVEALKKKFAALDRDPQTAKREKRLAQLEPRVSKSSDPEDLAAISQQQKEAFYRCE
jgi:hypothetical protein